MIHIAIMSDIHYGKLAAYEDFSGGEEHLDVDAENAISMKDEIVKLYKEFKPEYLFLPGDLTSRALPSEFQKLEKLLLDINKKSGCDPVMLYAAGNHDTQWHISNISDDPVDKGELLAIASIPFERNFSRKMQFTKQANLPFAGEYEDERIHAVVLNTGYFSRSDEDYHHGKIGIEQLEWLKTVFPLSDSKWRIVLMHHHPFPLKYPTISKDISCIEEGADLIDFIARSGVDLVVHGHRHHPIIRTKYDNTWANPITFLCAGSVSVQAKYRFAGSIPNTFHIVEMENEKAISRIIKTLNYEFSAIDGWRISKYKDETPYDGISYYGEIIENAELVTELEKIIDIAKESTESSRYFDLPQYQDLPLRLKCVGFSEINQSLESVLKLQGMKKTGFYPENITVKR